MVSSSPRRTFRDCKMDSWTSCLKARLPFSWDKWFLKICQIYDFNQCRGSKYVKKKFKKIKNMAQKEDPNEDAKYASVSRVFFKLFSVIFEKLNAICSVFINILLSFLIPSGRLSLGLPSAHFYLEVVVMLFWKGCKKDQITCIELGYFPPSHRLGEKRRGQNNLPPSAL